MKIVRLHESEFVDQRVQKRSQWPNRTLSKTVRLAKSERVDHDTKWSDWPYPKVSVNAYETIRLAESNGVGQSVTSVKTLKTVRLAQSKRVYQLNDSKLLGQGVRIGLVRAL